MGHLGRHTPIDEVLALAARFAPLGWHLQIHGDPALLTDLAPALRARPMPVVIDHIGRIDAALGMDQPEFQALLKLMADERFWVKVSGMDRITRLGPPYADAQPFAPGRWSPSSAIAWCGATTGRIPTTPGPMPDEQQLVDLIAEIAPTAAARQALLVDNPQRLYQFGDNT